MKSLWITLLIRLMFGLVFLVYGTEKLINYPSSVEIMAGGFEGTVLPHIVVLAFLYLLPFIEVLIGLAYLTGYRYRMTLLITGILMALFNFGLAIRGEHDHVARNLVYFFILLIGLWQSDNNRFVLFGAKSPEKSVKS